MIRSALLLLLVTAICAGCRTSSDVSVENPKDGSFVISGRMEFIDVETGCWVLVSDDGRRFEPSGENSGPLWKQGLRVTVRLRPLKGVASVCQTGVIVVVDEILESHEE